MEYCVEVDEGGGVCGIPTHGRTMSVSCQLNAIGSNAGIVCIRDPDIYLVSPAEYGVCHTRTILYCYLARSLACLESRPARIINSRLLSRV